GSFTLCTLYIGIISVVSTFAAQCYGRGTPQFCSRYCWQGIYLSSLGILFSAVLWPVTPFIFGLMNHTPEVTRLETQYFQIRLFSYFFIGCNTAVVGFFQAIDHPRIPMYTAIVGNAINLLLNYVLIFGHFGFPKLGVAGAAVATVIAIALQSILLLAIFLNSRFNREFGTRTTYQFDWNRIRELVHVGLPAAISMFLDVANWWIFVAFIVGRFGAVQLAANTIALSFMHVCFMPAFGLNQGIAAIVGQWLGRRDIPRAKSRVYTAIKIATCYMMFMGITFGLFGGILIKNIFNTDNDVAWLGHKMLILAACFQAFDAVNIVCMGALRGAGDTRWMMYMTFFMSYFVCLPLAWFFAVELGLESFGAWIGATLFICILSGVLFRRFYNEGWRDINIFIHTQPESTHQN
ncbi:MAG: MATE family efflux transporter, partial [Candidatus Hydrogenedentes bacterium]|nr:MATE family efflux transporter [Candidatus Hydrogenedentota bacterium]